MLVTGAGIFQFTKNVPVPIKITSIVNKINLVALFMTIPYLFYSNPLIIDLLKSARQIEL